MGVIRALKLTKLLKFPYSQLFVPFGGKRYPKATAMHFGGVWGVVG